MKALGNKGRKNKYETHVEPNLKKIKKMYLSMTEAQIAQCLGVTPQSFINYKKQYPELAEVLKESKMELIGELKSTLKKKALGYTYTETKETHSDRNGKEVVTITKYAHPDTGAIHLLLKNLDPSWRNDDNPTYELKKKQVDIMKQRSEEWS